jgi:hydroxyacylglutathione hydrolase
MSEPTTIVPVRHDPFNIAKSFLVIGPRVVIVDTGPPGGDRAVRRALAAAGRGPADVSLIVATHAHVDHVGGAAALRRWSGAPIAIDPRERPYVEGGRRAPTTPTGLVGRLFRLTPLPRQPFEAFAPEITIDAAFDLRAFGVDARVLHSGGHTPGSVSLHVPGVGEVIASDLLAGGIGIGGICLHGRVIEPPFHEDRRGVVAAVAALLALGELRTIHVCHGGPLRPRAVERWLARRVRRSGGAGGLAS